MKIEVNENRQMVLKEVFTGVGLETADKESMNICMRDSGFEFTYEGKDYSAQRGVIQRIGKVDEKMSIPLTQDMLRLMATRLTRRVEVRMESTEPMDLGELEVDIYDLLLRCLLTIID
jgi:hypothetical protein